jgi:hypothetical protein
MRLTAAALRLLFVSTAMSSSTHGCGADVPQSSRRCRVRIWCSMRKAPAIPETMFPVTKRACPSNRLFRVSGLRVRFMQAHAVTVITPAPYSDGSDGLLMNTGREGSFMRQHNGRNRSGDLGLVPSGSRQVFLALVPSGRNTPCRIRIACWPPFSRFPRTVCAARRAYTSVPSPVACAKKHKMLFCLHLVVVAPRRLLRRSGIFHDTIN